MFESSVYSSRRRQLIQRMTAGTVESSRGIAVFVGNADAAMNYRGNDYKFRQDSSFLYFFGQHRDGLVGVIDCESGVETLVGDEIDIDDIVWYGSVTSVVEMAQQSGVAETAPMAKLSELVAAAKAQGRKVHFLPPYRHDTMIQLMDLTGIHPSQQKAEASLALINAVVKLRSKKSAEEIAEMIYERHELFRTWLTSLGVDEKIASEDAKKSAAIAEYEAELQKKNYEEQLLQERKLFIQNKKLEKKT